VSVQPTESVSAVVCTQDERRWDAFSRAIASLRDQTRSLEEIIVVVDHNPSLLERVRRELPGVIALANQNERGLSNARNSAIEVATGSSVAFLDDDATAAADWIERLSDACRDPSILGAGGAVLPRWLAARPPWFPEEFLWVVGCTYRGMPVRRAAVRNLHGGCFFIRRYVVAELGGFHVDLGRVGSNRMGCEETELCIRAARRWPGRVFRYEPAAIIFHEVTADRTTWAYFRSRCFAEGRSKAILTRLVGAHRGLSSERAYASRVLPLGIVRELSAGLAERDVTRIARAGAIAGGLAATTAGYMAGLRDGSWGSARRMPRESPKFPSPIGDSPRRVR
jgi:glucosyl-dolichyl phosphate glucuronosyltransferase